MAISTGCEIVENMVRNIISGVEGGDMENISTSKYCVIPKPYYGYQPTTTKNFYTSTRERL